MKLPLCPPFPPMEARAVDRIPSGPEWQYEPKWDGFRCLAFREGNTVELQYDHFTGGRFRHGTRFLRWRPDKAARQCTMDEVNHPTSKVSL